jgi:hypothetical protein
MMAGAMRASKTQASTHKTLANHEVVVLATYLAGGRISYTDIEDIAVKANIAWRRRFADWRARRCCIIGEWRRSSAHLHRPWCRCTILYDIAAWRSKLAHQVAGASTWRKSFSNGT